MEFKTVAESFNHWRPLGVEAMEKRAKEIKTMIENNNDVDMRSLNVELQGIKEAKEDIKETRSQNVGTLNPVESMKVEQRSFSAETVADTPEYRSAFFKTMLGQELNAVEKRAMNAGIELAEKRADAFNASTDSLAILPTETLNEVIAKARKQGGLLAEVRAFNMPVKVSIPIATPGAAAGWHTEGAEVESEAASIASVTFDGHEIMKVLSISAKVRKMSIPAFEAYLVDELTGAIMETLNEAIVNGTGSGQGTGIVSGITWDESNSVSGAIDYANIVETVALLPRGYSTGAKWVMSNACLYRNFYGLVDAQKRPIFIQDPQTEGIGKILGFPVIIDDFMPADTAILGNFAKYAGVNIPEGIAVEVSRESSFRKGLIDYRAMCIADCKPIVSEAFVKLSKTA